MQISSSDLLTIPIGVKHKELIEGIELNIEYSPEDMTFNNFVLKDELNGYNIMINDNIEGNLSLIVYANSNVENLDNILGHLSFSICLQYKLLP